MSRLPQPSSSRTGTKPNATATPASRLGGSTLSSRLASPSTSRLGTPASTPRLAKSASTSRLVVPSSPKSRATSPTKAAPSPTPSPARPRTKSSARPPPKEEAPPMPKAPPLSLKEAIAQKRAEAKKAMAAQHGDGSPRGGSVGVKADPWGQTEEASAEVELGRWSVRDTIERARNTGSLNLSSRSLPCIPSALFEIHLGVKAAPLQSVPEEPPLPESNRKHGHTAAAPSWFEQKDLAILGAWNNEIVELQPEISLFGSLKNIDLHSNRLTSLPDTFADLTSLTTLDLSHNALSSLPFHFFALPALSSLNISHNAFTSLPFNTPFSPDASAVAPTRPRSRSNDFFEPAIVRADIPLPKLVILNASHNKILAAGIETTVLPQGIVRIDLSDNPLVIGSASAASQLLSAFSTLSKLEELSFKRANLDDTAFPSNLLANSPHPFEKLTSFDLEETQVTKDAVIGALSSFVSKELNFDVSSDDEDLESPTRRSPSEPNESITVIVGKKVVREKWELEADRRVKLRSMRSAASLRAASLAQEEAASLPVPALPQKRADPPKKQLVKKEVLKEQWEIDAEQGLLTEGGRRLARAQAALKEPAATEADMGVTDGDAVSSALVKGKYYEPRSQTLILPPLAPPSRTHGRGFSLTSNATRGASTDLTLPTTTLPLSLIVVQSFADTLRVLELKGRRADSSFALPESDGPVLPRLEDLSLEGCGLGDDVPTTTGEERARQDTLATLVRLFPSLKTLDLSYNNLTSGALASSTLATLLLAADGRAGLKHLRLRGNRLANLDTIQALAKTLFAGGDGDDSKASWRLEELDVRENAIEALGGELGLLPLDVLLVEGNAFRIPARRVWEREGTRGLLTWLRSRLE